MPNWILEQPPALLATLAACLTWAVTALGALTVFFLPRKATAMEPLLAASAGVMLAASFWSLLEPAIAQARQVSALPCWLVAALGFLGGGLFLVAGDAAANALQARAGRAARRRAQTGARPQADDGPRAGRAAQQKAGRRPQEEGRTARTTQPPASQQSGKTTAPAKKPTKTLIGAPSPAAASRRRCMLLVSSITLHNIPEGLAIGVAFGGLGRGATPAALAAAASVALGIGLQNFPEGAAVSLPLLREGYSRPRAFWLGQLSGLVEPLAAAAGALLVTAVQSVLPWALAAAAGAMVYVAAHELLPEAQRPASRTGVTLACLAGFALMMVLDVALGG